MRPPIPSRWLGALLPLLTTGCMDFSMEPVCESYPDKCRMRITRIEPSLGFLEGGTTVTVRGTAFEPATQVFVNGTPAETRVEFFGSLTITMPPGPAPHAWVDLTVRNAREEVEAPRAFLYVPRPFGSAIPLPVAPSQLSVVADFSGDGRMDLVASDKVLIQTPQGTFTVAGTLSEPLASRTLMGDLNHDGWQDLLLLSWCCDSPRVMLGTGPGTFAPASRLVLRDPWSDWSGLTHADLGDLDQDGHLDLVAGGSAGIALVRGKGDGTFHPPAALLEGVAANGERILDVDADQQLDLVLTQSNRVHVWYGAGDGTFSRSVALSAKTPIYSVEPGDLNGDGRMDLVATTGDALIVWLGLPGDRGFSTQGIYNDGSGAPFIHDFDGDGRQDVISGGNISFGQGNGTLLPGLPLESGLSVSQMADLNQDGRMDLVVASWKSGTPSAGRILLGR